MPFTEPEDAEALISQVAAQNLRDYPELCDYGLYRLGPVYAPEKKGSNQILTIGDISRTGVFDCEDGTAARLAECWQKGQDARPRIIVSDRNPTIWHAVLEHPDGSYEDPSVALHPQTPLAQRRAYVPAHGTLAIDFVPPEGHAAETLYVTEEDYPELDVGSFWFDVAPRVLAAAVPLGSTILKAAYPGLGEIAEEAIIQAQLAKRPKSALSKIATAKMAHAKRGKDRNTLCKLHAMRFPSVQRYQQWARCMRYTGKLAPKVTGPDPGSAGARPIDSTLSDRELRAAMALQQRRA